MLQLVSSAGPAAGEGQRSGYVWALFVPRLPLDPTAAAAAAAGDHREAAKETLATQKETLLNQIDKHIRLSWVSAPTQSGSLSLLSLLQSAAKAARRRRGPPGAPQGAPPGGPPGGPQGKSPPPAAGGPPGAPGGPPEDSGGPHWEETNRLQAAAGASPTGKQRGEAAAAEQQQQQQQQQEQQQQQGEGDEEDPVAPHELMDLLQLSHLESPKIYSE
ncbi:hypothetical protein ETH_00037965 [Eimeria tenella]|uniref:Uncharacterized protein n=1 Tax=Eimeria tenella TaxID=5802 RepID=U6L2U1_EIMTE|nr:hypothetical protein ETH_00037965 [Eimeria tenella]CDJ44471.1 hypothetical protein ETH_00037965 [Eimeria tenella]|eukprot:XP_013235220.1 hypothetical protein ETH_00037965 [Eimeria tenella]